MAGQDLERSRGLLSHGATIGHFVFWSLDLARGSDKSSFLS